MLAHLMLHIHPVACLYACCVQVAEDWLGKEHKQKAQATAQQGGAGSPGPGTSQAAPVLIKAPLAPGELQAAGQDLAGPAAVAAPVVASKGSPARAKRGALIEVLPDASAT